MFGTNGTIGSRIQKCVHPGLVTVPSIPHPEKFGTAATPRPGQNNPDMETRNVEIVRRYETGESLASIGVTLGLTRERVRQIVRDSGVAMPRDYKCAVPDCDVAQHAPNSYCFSHSRRLALYGDPLSAAPARWQHGTVHGYQNRDCRCDRCRKAYADYRREREHRRHPEMRRYAPRRVS